ncbi:hypothetical protein B0H14DRAFT_3909867 [Mycena olivaceomarginata]|nr:hypothetical protein B0H14DRAFT_3909867 [Mycena olivaceomarginata]
MAQCFDNWRRLALQCATIGTVTSCLFLPSPLPLRLLRRQYPALTMPISPPLKLLKSEHFKPVKPSSGEALKLSAQRMRIDADAMDARPLKTSRKVDNIIDIEAMDAAASAQDQSGDA